MNLLTVVVFLPLIGALITLAGPKSSGFARMCATCFSGVTFLLSLGLLEPFYFSSPNGWVFVSDVAWMETPAVRFHMAIDGVSLWLVLLTTLISVLCVAVSWNSAKVRSNSFFGMILMAQCGILGVFVSLDLVLFYLFWELCLVPVYLLLGVWGENRRSNSAVTFYVYTMIGSVLMLGSIIFLYVRSGTGDLSLLTAAIRDGHLVFGGIESLLLFLGFFFAFAIKVPIIPFHGWLADAYVDSPMAATILLSALMSKMGAYGLLRFCVTLFPKTSSDCAPWVVALAVIGIVYCALVALVQSDMKRLVAYSSVSHLGFVVLGIFSLHQNGLDGAVYQMVSHGVSTGALFALIGFLQERRHSLAIREFGGVAISAPNLAKAFMIAMLASMGLPLLSNFVGEFLILQGASLRYFSWAAFAATGVILAACYLLWLYQRVFYGKPAPSLPPIMDLTGREYAALTPLLVLIVWMGTFTQSFMPSISASNARVLASISARVSAPESSTGSR